MPSLQKAKQRMEGALEGMRREFASVRTGKAIVPPVGIRVPTYAVRVDGDDVYVTVDWPDG